MGGYWSKQQVQDEKEAGGPESEQLVQAEKREPDVTVKKPEEKQEEKVQEEVKSVTESSEITSNLSETKPPNVFKEVIEETGTKVEVIPVTVSPTADVVKKGKKKNKNKN